MIFFCQIGKIQVTSVLRPPYSSLSNIKKKVAIKVG